MFTNKKFRPIVLTWLVALVAGCGGSPDIKPIKNLIPCSGTVTLDGQPLPQGTVTFAPVNQADGQPATGSIKDGKFTANTTATAPGVVAAKYRVSIVATEKPQDIKPGVIPPPPASLIPAKYNNPATSGFEVEVKKGMDPIELKLSKS